MKPDFNDLTKQQTILLNVFVSVISAIVASVVVIAVLGNNEGSQSRETRKIANEKSVATTSPEKQEGLKGKQLEASEVPEIREKANRDQEILGIAEGSLESVVEIVRMTPEGGAIHEGLGFFVSRDGKIMTSTTALSNSLGVLYGGEIYSARELGEDVETGVVLLQIEGLSNKEGIKPLAIENGEISEGDRVVALAGESGYNILLGEIRETTHTDGGLLRVITDIVFSLESSGSPLIGGNGKVIGLNVVFPSGSYAIRVTEGMIGRLGG